jgi:hypothetical protein
MVPYMEAETIPPHWSDLLQSSSELASKQAFNLAQAWLGSTGQDNTDLQIMDNPVDDPFAIVTDHHNGSISKNIHLDQAPNITYQKQPPTTMVLSQTKMAVSEGGTLTLVSKLPLINAADSVPLTSQATIITSQIRSLSPATISEPSMAKSVDELKLPPHLNLCESVTTKSAQPSTCCMGY